MCSPSSPTTAVTTTAFADFCRVTRRIAAPRAGRLRYRSPPNSFAQGWWLPWRLDLRQLVGPAGSIRHRLPRHSRQISPNKNTRYRCTTAAFTLPTVTMGLGHPVLTRPRAGPSMQFLFVGSHLCTPASFRPSLASGPCLRLMVVPVSFNRSVTPIGDLHPVSLCPCRAYTVASRGPPTAGFTCLRSPLMLSVEAVENISLGARYPYPLCIGLRLFGSVSVLGQGFHSEHLDCLFFGLLSPEFRHFRSSCSSSSCNS